MKRIITSLSLVMLLLLSAHAVTYTDIVISPTENTLLTARPALSTLLPADFLTTVFDGSGDPTMDRLYIFMTMPSISDYEITALSPRITLTPNNPANLGEGFDMGTELPSFTLQTGKDVLFAFKRDGSGYVLDGLPFDPTTRALDEVMIAKETTEKVYLTGHINGKLSAELPERVQILMPSYLESLRQAMSDLFVAYIKQEISGMGLDDFSFNPNCEGFFSFTGDTATHLHLYTDNLSLSVKDKKTDFLGSIVAGMATVNLMGLESVDDNATTYTNSYLSDMTTEQVQQIDEQSIRKMPVEQILLIAQKMSQTQCGYLTHGQILTLLGYTDILQAFAASPSDIETALYFIFGDADKAQTVGDKLNGITDAIMSALAPMMSNPMSLITGGGGLDLMTMMGKLFSSFVEGTASPFAFKSNSQQLASQAYHVHIHSKGENTITGGAEGEFKNTSEEMAGLLQLMNLTSNKNLASMVNDLAIMFEAMVRFSSAPFAVRPSAKMIGKDEVDEYQYTCTRLFFDDIWVDGTTRTNGLMQMPVVGKNIDAPSIDIGTPNGQVEFNGGRYKFHTPVSNKKLNMFYVATMAICYREFTVTMPFVNQKITYTGIGTSVGWGPQHNRADNYRNVIFHDGTFTTYSAEAWKSAERVAEYGADYKIDAVGNGWYEHYTDLRLPYNTSILGGTFPEDTYVRRCDAAAEQGVAPVYIYQPTELATPHYTPLCERKQVAAPTLSESFVTGQTTPVSVDNDKESALLFKVNGTSDKWNYGHLSLMADAGGMLYLYVPGDCKIDNTYMRNYVTALAPFGESKSGTVMLSMGGDVEVKSLYQDNDNFPLKNGYLLYTQLGYYSYYKAGVNLGGLFRTLQEEFQIDRAQHHNFKNTSMSTNESGQTIMNTTDTTGVVFSEVTNDNQYVIEYGLYMMIPVMSDQWMLFSPPFDVANVYIMETTAEQPKSYRTWTNDDFHSFFERQGGADGDMAQTLVTSVLPDIFSGRGSGVLKPLTYILREMTNDETRLTRLTHFNGDNFMTANYYLNEQVPDIADTHKWEQEDDEKKYGNKWEAAPSALTPTYITRTVANPDCDIYDEDCEDIIVTQKYVNQDGEERPAAEQQIIMKRDGIYSMYFPGGANRWYDYKYLIIEGYGPQRINGKNAHLSFANPDQSSPYFPEEGYVALQGNSTFGNDVISGISSAHPLFFTQRQQTGTYPTGTVNYTFVANTNSTQKILPSSVYMVSSTNAATKASMPALHLDNTKATGLIENPNLPTLEQLSLEVWTDNGIYLRALQEQHIEIFSTTGTLLWQGTVNAGTTTFVHADRGMYIIRGEESTVKVVN